jgi:hypothetical protein
MKFESEEITIPRHLFEKMVLLQILFEMEDELRQIPQSPFNDTVFFMMSFLMESYI